MFRAHNIPESSAEKRSHVQRLSKLQHKRALGSRKCSTRVCMYSCIIDNSSPTLAWPLIWSTICVAVATTKHGRDTTITRRAPFLFQLHCRCRSVMAFSPGINSTVKIQPCVIHVFAALHIRTAPIFSVTLSTRVFSRKTSVLHMRDTNVTIFELSPGA